VRDVAETLWLGAESDWVFDAGVNGRRRVCAAKRFTGLAGAGIPGRNSKQERKPMSKIIQFLGLDVHQETAGVSIVPDRNLRRGWMAAGFGENFTQIGRARLRRAVTSSQRQTSK